MSEEIKRGPGRPPKTEYEQESAPIEAVQAVASPETISPGMQEFLQTLVNQMKQPSVLEQKAIEEEAEERRKHAEMRVANAERQERAMKAQQAACGHINKKKQHTFVAQVHSDGYYRPICQICHKEFPKIKASTDQIAGGVNLHEYEGITERHLLSWAGVAV